MADLFDIAGLIAADKVVKPVDINLTDSYIQIGTFSPENRKKGGAANSYPSLVMSLADIVSGGGGTYSGDGTTIVLNPGNIFSFASMNISQFTNDLGYITSAGPIPTTAGNTLLTCITDIFVQNVNSCSPLNINASNGQDVLIVAGGGNVGIGTAAPTRDLHIIRNTPGFAQSVAIQVQNTAASGFSFISTKSDNNVNGASLVTFNSAGGVGTFYDNNNAGLGVNAPFGLLVNENAAGGWIMTAGGYGAAQERFRVTTTQSSFIRNKVAITDSTIAFTATASLHARGIDATSANYVLKTDNIAGSPILYVRNDGNVGIGITTPLAKLHVQNPGAGTTILGAVADNLGGWQHIATVSGGNGFLFLESGGSSNNVLNFRALVTGGGGGGIFAVYNATGQRIFEANGTIGVNKLVVQNDAITGALEVQAAGDVIAYQKLGVGIALPIAKLHVQNTQDGIGTGIPSLYYNTTVGGILAQYQSVDGYKETFTEGANLRGSFTNAGGFSNWMSSGRMEWRTMANISKMWMDNADGRIAIGGNGYFAATAQAHIQGQDATAANFALRVEDSAGNRIMSSRNDGKTFFGPRFCYLSSSNIISGGEFNMVAEQLFLLDSTISEVRIEALNKPLIFNTWHGGATNNEVAFAGRGAAGFSSFVRTYDVTTTETGFKTYIGASAAVGDTNFRHCFVYGNVHIGYDELVNTNTTKLTIRSRNALQTENNLLLEDNASAVLLKVRNNGEVNMPSLPTAAAGLVSGDLWDNAGVVNIVP